MGDRIAIMSKGRLRCCGSPLYLKSKYSSDYLLIISKKPSNEEGEGEEGDEWGSGSRTTSPNNEQLARPSSIDVEGSKMRTAGTAMMNEESSGRITRLVKKLIPDAKLNEDLNSEISFVLPAEHTARFSELFEQLEDNKRELRIDNIGISISTLEDVFLKYTLLSYQKNSGI